MDVDSDKMSVDTEGKKESGEKWEAPPTLFPAVSPSDLVEATAVKAEGNKLFAAGSLAEAAEVYSRGLTLLQPPEVPASFQIQDKEHQTLWVSFSLNLAQVNLKMSQHAAAIKNCRRVLQVDAGNVKALYRLGSAQQGL